MAASISKSGIMGGGVYGCSTAPLPPPFAIKFKPNELSMRFHHQRVNLKPIIMASSSNYVQNQSSVEEEEDKQGGSPSPLQSLWSLFKLRDIVVEVVLRDEDGLIKEKFDRIIVDDREYGNFRHSLHESLDCLLENADCIIHSCSLVCSSDIQLLGNLSKLDKHNNCFTMQKVAKDDINCALVILFMSTSDEIGDENIHTLQDFKAFLQKLRSIKRDRLVFAMPCSCRNVYLTHILNSSKRYSHLSAQIETSVGTNIMESGGQLIKMCKSRLADFFSRVVSSNKSLK